MRPSKEAMVSETAAHPDEAASSEEMRKAHEDLSAIDWKFRQWARQDLACLRRSTFDGPHPLRALVAHDLQPWPTFVSASKIGQLADAGQAVSRLVRQIPQRVFQNAPERMAEFYGLRNADLVTKLLSSPNGIAEAASRSDFVGSTEGLKCLEFNSTANLGGWESSIMADIVLRVPVIERFVRQHGLRFSITDSLRKMLSYAIRRAQGAGFAEGQRVHLAVLVLEGSHLLQHPMAPRILGQVLDAACREVDPALSGRLLLARGDELEERPEGLFVHGQRIHTLLAVQLAAGGKLIFKAFKKKQLHLYNSPADVFLNDKRNFALLSEQPGTGPWNPAEEDLIRAHIPWTRCFQSATSGYRGETIQLPELAITQQRRMVLKKALSLGGHDVVLGKSVDTSTWDRAVDKALRSGDWILQELVDSRPYLYQNGEEGCTAHDLVWGVFVFGEVFGGTTLRVLPKAAHGIVNATQGATKSLVLELSTPS